MSITLQSDSVPGEIKVSESWLRLIRWCLLECPHGEIKVKIVNGEPTTLLESRRNIRFDKPLTISPKIDFVGDG